MFYLQNISLSVSFFYKVGEMKGIWRVTSVCLLIISEKSEEISSDFVYEIFIYIFKYEFSFMNTESKY